jgi:hypothetical protein
MQRTGEDTCDGRFGQAKSLIKQHDHLGYPAKMRQRLHDQANLLRCRADTGDKTEVVNGNSRRALFTESCRAAKSL